jgi:hypothetical protein
MQQYTLISETTLSKTIDSRVVIAWFYLYEL